MGEKAVNRFRGDTFPFGIKVTKVVGQTRLPADIENCTFTLSVSKIKMPTKSDYVFQSEGVLVDLEEALVEFPLKDTNVDFIGTLYYDIQMTDASGKKKTIAKDDWKYEQDINKD